MLNRLHSCLKEVTCLCVCAYKYTNPCFNPWQKLIEPLYHLGMKKLLVESDPNVSFLGQPVLIFLLGCLFIPSKYSSFCLINLVNGSYFGRDSGTTSDNVTDGRSKLILIVLFSHLYRQRYRWYMLVRY